MMYKVLIVDDERTVREGLNSLIPWEDYGFQVVGLAKDAETAYSLFHELSPDLVISDIRMYGMNGLDLIKRLREINKVFQCIILSGYADFDYAKKAIQNNVAGYLLKPIYEEELIEYLEKVKIELSKQHAVTELTESEETRRREQYILSLIGSDHHVFSEQETKQFDLDWDRYQVLLMKVDNSFVMDTDMFKLKKEVEFLINKDIALFVSEPYIGLVLNATEYRTKEVQQLYQDLKLSLESYAHSITFSLGQVVESLNGIQQSYKSAFQMIQRKFFYPKEQLLAEGMQIDTQYSEGQIEVAGIIDNMYFALDLGVYDSLRETTNDMFVWAMQDLSEKNVKKKIVYVMTTVFNKLQKSKGDKEDFFTSMLEKVLELYQQPSFEDVKNVVNELMNDVLSELEYADSDHQLKKLLLLIENKYNENLKLEQLAKLFNYNSAYLGKLFKSYTGEYFNTYVDKVRIKNAKKLLLQGQKVYRVAEIVGYNNVDYFHSKFKKYEGVSPSAYKRKMIKSD